MHPLFREPLRYDVLTWLWLVAVAGVYVLHLRLSTWVSAWAFILAGVVVSSAFVLLVALIRYLVDGPQRRVHGARTMREVLGIDVLPGVGDWGRHDPPPAAQDEPDDLADLADDLPEDVEDTVVVEVADTRPVAALVDEREEVTVRLPVAPVEAEPDAVEAVVEPEPVVVPAAPVPVPQPEPVVAVAPVPVAPAPAAPPLERPRALRIEVNEVRIAQGSPVTVTWSFEGADTVVVDGRTGFPSHGQTTVALRHSRSVVLIGANAAGVAAVSTPEIEVVPEPEPTPEPGPRPMPAVQRLQLDLRGNAAGADSVLTRLDEVMRAQDRLRPYTSAPVRPLGVPSSFTRWLRSHPKQRFISHESYLDALQRRPGTAGASPTARRGARPETRPDSRSETDRTDP